MLQVNEGFFLAQGFQDQLIADVEMNWREKVSISDSPESLFSFF
jgi:hypothetical protein